MSHPYTEFEATTLWRVLDSELASLELNRDVRLDTARWYVLGSLCQRLIDEGLVQTPRRDDVPAT